MRNLNQPFQSPEVIDETNPFTASMPKLERVTDKYRFISTQEFIRDVEGLGYSLTDTRQPRRGLGMHSMSFSHPDMPKLEGIGLRLLATNSHDATSAFRLSIQLDVAVCTNVLVAFLPDLSKASRVVHRGYALEKVAAAIDTVRARIDGVLGTVDALQGTQATPENTVAFLQLAKELRDAKPFNALELTQARHYEQRENTGWNVFNRVQESLIKGRYRTIETVTRLDGTTLDVPGRRAREITNVRERVVTNYKLWDIAVQTLLKKA